MMFPKAPKPIRDKAYKELPFFLLKNVHFVHALRQWYEAEGLKCTDIPNWKTKDKRGNCLMPIKNGDEVVAFVTCPTPDLKRIVRKHIHMAEMKRRSGR